MEELQSYGLLAISFQAQKVNLLLIEVLQIYLGDSEAAPIVEYKGHTESITGAHINKFNTRAYTSSLDKTCKIWDLFSGTLIKTITWISGIHSMVVDSMETTAFLGCKNKNVYCMPIDTIVDTQNQQQRKPKKVLNQQKNEITWMALTKSENRLVVGTSDGILFIYSNLSKCPLKFEFY